MDALATVLANPGSNEARRALADAGDPRAPLIRAQLVQWTETQARRLGSPADLAAVKEANALLRAHRAEWSQAVAPLVTEAMFVRGLVGEVKVSVDRLVPRFDDLLDLAPVQHLRLEGPIERWAELVTHPRFAQIASIDLHRVTAFDDTAAIALAQSSSARGLRWLSLRGTSITRAGVEAIAASPHLSALAFLGLADTAFDASPSVWDDEAGITHVDVRPEGTQLAERYGAKEWISPTDVAGWPPSPDQLAAR